MPPAGGPGTEVLAQAIDEVAVVRGVCASRPDPPRGHGPRALHRQVRGRPYCSIGSRSATAGVALVTRSTIPISFLGWQNRKEWENGDRHVTAEELHGVAVTRLSGSTTSLDTSRSWPRGPSVAAAGVMVPSPRRLPHSISPLEGDGFAPSVPRARRPVRAPFRPMLFHTAAIGFISRNSPPPAAHSMSAAEKRACPMSRTTH